MIIRSLYLSDPDNLQIVSDYLGMSEEEIEMIVGGRFSKQSRWAGLVKGKFEETDAGRVYLRTSFGSKTLWSDEIC